MAEKKEILFYTGGSPNGVKVAIALEELGLPYKVIALDMPALQHKEPWYLAINPNGRIPAITDTLENGTAINIFESGSILQYLVDRYDTDHKFSYPRGTKEFYQTNSWVWRLCIR
jgi:glutathione S-transferase